MGRTPHAGERFRAALGCARRGIPVLPLHHPVISGPPTRIGCSCEEPACLQVGAHPIPQHGVEDATTDPLRIAWWWRRFPEANLGLATGYGFDALVVHGSEGDSARWLLVAEALRASGPLVRTGGDGWHFYFAPTGLASHRPLGLARIEWLGVGAWVAAPPSRHASGAVAAWVRDLDVPLPAAPAAIRARLDLPGPSFPWAGPEGSGPEGSGEPRRGAPVYRPEGSGGPGQTLRAGEHEALASASAEGTASVNPVRIRD
jgi:Bifunctional DNA primase/polymerase, N-terminal